MKEDKTQETVYCKDCKYVSFHYQRFTNHYVCRKNMDKWGRIPEEDLKGHNGFYTCAYAERRVEDA